MPENATAEPGMVPAGPGLLMIALANLLVIIPLIVTSRWHGWRLALTLALAYYGAVTFQTQIETWYFLSTITVSPQLLLRLFLMGVPTAFLFIPLAVWILGKGREVNKPPEISLPSIAAGQWIGKLIALIIVYIVLYFGAGYFIAWQNPQLRAFYGHPGEAAPFLTLVSSILRDDPSLFMLQILRAVIWVLCALPVMRGSKLSVGRTAILVGLLFSVPQNVAHIIANPLMPVASVRLSHMIETSTSTFLFGLCVVWLLHRQHDSLSDLFGTRDSGREQES
jgi:hypothetical protein